MEAAGRVKLALLAAIARNGATEDEVLAFLAFVDGEQMILLTEVDKSGRHHDVQVKVGRVHGIGPNFDGGTVLVFTDLEPMHPKYRLVVEEEPHKVARRLREKGWQW